MVAPRLSTEGNLNNHVGVPATLFRLRPSHVVAGVEMGTNHFGEVKRLAETALPTHGLITNVGREHLQFFRTVAGVAKAEGELFNHLAASGGTAFVNADGEMLLVPQQGRLTITTELGVLEIARARSRCCRAAWRSR